MLNLRTVNMKNGIWWLRGLLAIQLLCVGASLYSVFLMQKVAMDVGLATPTCPDGAISIRMAPETTLTCRDERIKLYQPVWIMPLFWGSVLGIPACLAGGVWLIRKIRKEAGYSLQWMLLSMWGIFVVALIVYVFILHNWFG